MSELVKEIPQSERPVQTPEKPQNPPGPEGVKTDVPQNQSASLDAAREAAGKELSAPATVESSLDAAEEQSGAKKILTPEEEKAWREWMETVIKNGSKDRPKAKDQLFVDEIGFRDYLKTFGEVSQRYGLGITNPKVALIEAGFIVKGIVDGFNPVRITKWAWEALNKKEAVRFENLPNKPRLGQMIIENGKDKIINNMSMEHTAAVKLDANNGDFSKLDSESQRVLALGKLKQWGPFLTGLATLPLSIVTNKAQEALAGELLGVKQNVNTRVANSLLMAEFDASEKRNPGAMIGAVERGKAAIATLVFHTYRSFLPGVAALAAATVPLVRENLPSAILAGGRGLMLLMTGKARLSEAILESQEEAKRRGTMEGRIMAIMNGMELVKTDDTEGAAQELARQLTDRDRLLSGMERAQSEAEKKREWINRAFTYGTPVVSVGWKALMDRGKKNGEQKAEGTDQRWGLKDYLSVNKWKGNWPKMVWQGAEYAVPFWNAYASQEITDKTVNNLVGLYHGTLKAAVRDIKKMEEYLGDYDALDRPDGPKELMRRGADTIEDWTIRVNDLGYKNILRGVNLEIPQGSFIAIRGVSGEGKTTLLRQMAGLYPPETGAVTVGKTAVGDIKRFGEQSYNSRIAYAPQKAPYFPQMTFRENIKLWSRRAVTDEKIRETLVKLGMEKFGDRLDEKVDYLSGGELQRVGLTRALVKDPKILFIDEPTNNLDRESIQKLMDLIVGIQKDNPSMTMIAITHDEKFGAIVDRVVEMKELNKAPVLGEGQVLVGEYNTTNKQILPISNTTNKDAQN